MISSLVFGLTDCRSSDGPVKITSSSNVTKTASASAVACKSEITREIVLERLQFTCLKLFTVHILEIF